MFRPSETPSPSGWRLVVGLGNPGDEYAGTRHNVGFEAIDLLAARRGLRWQVDGPALCALDEAAHYALMKPLTYMNRSGAALRHFARKHPLDGPASIFIVTDDFHLPLGALRVRPDGSTGGHNGLASIEAEVGSKEYPRLRIGVGEPGSDAVDFVLSRFSVADRRVLEECLETASWCAEDWVRGSSLEDLRARYNRRTPQAGS
ncbi:MAG: aminoacyl-tRNA hydrolase [Planctomycetota bacterium]|nr:aminoacyl-tRNA hydrolase [Planctomycetota bacterium]